jgi:hypothetical protein
MIERRYRGEWSDPSYRLGYSTRRLTSLKDGLLMADVYYDHVLSLLPNKVDLDAIII